MTEPVKIHGYIVTPTDVPGRWRAVKADDPDIGFEGTPEELDDAAARHTKAEIAAFARFLKDVPTLADGYSDAALAELQRHPED